MALTVNQRSGKTVKLREQNRCFNGLCLGLLMGLSSGMVMANPENPTVVAGSASFSQNGGQLNITNSHGTIINWQEFSIGSGEITRFLQDSGQSAVLNRVTGGNISSLLGELNSNGKVFLVNPNGLFIGAGATINTNGFVGSTLNIADEDFTSGNFKFSGDGGSIVNNGVITSGPGGEVILIAPSVQNNGAIIADNGEILLAAGREVTLTSLNDVDISYRVSAPGDRAVNLGSLIATNGSAALLADQVVQHGTISANKVVQDAQGRIVLQGDTSTSVSGGVTALGQGTSGGDITILGDNIQLSGAAIDASGTNGGRVRIGGEYQGGGALPRASNTAIDSSTVVNANAIGRGNGGEIIVWSEVSTQSFGQLNARGGSTGGNGGLVETSSRGSLDFGQPADVSAVNGNPGTWLLDPEDIVIDSGHAASISTALNGGSNVQIQTAETGTGQGNITVAAPITKTEGGDAALGLVAHHTINVNAPITSTSGKLNVSLRAGADIKVNSAIVTNGGNYSASINPALASIPAPEEEVVEEEPVESPVTDAVNETPAPSTPQQVTETDNAAGASEGAEEPSQVADVSGSGTEPDSGNVGPTEAPGDATTIPEPTESITEIVIHDLGIQIEERIITNGGDIVLDAGEDGLLSVNSELTTTDVDSSGAGAGNIQLLGDQIALYDEADVNASGEGGAGNIHIGGGQQGLDPNLRNSNAVYIADSATVRADAIDQGDGGTIIIYADDTANIHGTISARGGEQGGDGGFIETSGKRSLSITKTPDVSAPNGSAGTWLIDPDEINVVAGNGNTNINNTSPFLSTGIANLGVDLVRTALLAGINVQITTANNGAGSGNINWLTDLDFDGFSLNNGVSALGSVSLTAHNDIRFEGSIYDTSFFDRLRINNLTLTADSDSDMSGDVIFDASNRPDVLPGQSFRGHDLGIDAAGDININANNLYFLAGSNDESEGVRVRASGVFNFEIREDILLRSNGFSSSVDVSASGEGSTINAKNLTLETTVPDTNTTRFDIGDDDLTNTSVLNVSEKLTLNGGSLSGDGVITTKDFDWKLGSLFGSRGTFNTSGVVTINPSAGSTRDFSFSRTFNVLETSTVNWEGGDIRFGSSSNPFNNRGTIIARSDNAFLGEFDSDSGFVVVNDFNNSGQFIKNGTSGGETAFGSATYSGDTPVAFNNTGLVRTDYGDITFYSEAPSDNELNILGNINQSTSSTSIRPTTSKSSSPNAFLGGFAQTAGMTHLQGGDISAREIVSSSNDLPGPTATMFFEGGEIVGGQNEMLETRGDLNANLDVSGATIGPGQSPGILNINGNLTADNTTTFNIEIDGIAPGSFDVINVSGNAQLNGPQMNVTFLSGYTPPTTLGVSDFFDVITANNITQGSPVFVNHPSLPPDVTGESGQAGNTVFFVAYTNGIPPVVPGSPPAVPGVMPNAPPNNPVVFNALMTPPGPNSPVMQPVMQSMMPQDLPDNSNLIVSLFDQQPIFDLVTEEAEFLQCF